MPPPVDASGAPAKTVLPVAHDALLARLHSRSSGATPHWSLCRSRSKRRARLCSIYFSMLVIQLINASMYLVPNVCNLYKDCRAGQLVDWAGVSSGVSKLKHSCVHCISMQLCSLHTHAL